MVAFGVGRLFRVRSLVPSFLFLFLLVFSPHQADAQRGGEAAGTVAGFQILHQTFHFKSGDPAMVESIEFNIAGESRPDRVRVMMSDYGPWFDCHLVPSASPNLARAQCDIGGIPVNSLHQLRVVATGG